MDAREVVRRRLAANGLAAPRTGRPEDVVGSLLAVQSQDVQPSAWSVAQRLTGGTEDDVERARASGRLLRTHVLRTTWHDVVVDDLRWLLALTGPRVVASTAGVRRELHLDDELFATARRTLDRALADRHLTRAEVGGALAGAGLALDARALTYVLMHLETSPACCAAACDAVARRRMPCSTSACRPRPSSTTSRRWPSWSAGSWPATAPPRCRTSPGGRACS